MDETTSWRNLPGFLTILYSPTLNSCIACSNALAFFCPTFAGNFIRCERTETPVPRRSVNLIPALSTACKQNKKLNKIIFFYNKNLKSLTLTTESTFEGLI